MRTKQDLLESTHRNALRSSKPEDIALIHQLHTLEVLIDIRDILADYIQSRESLSSRFPGKD